MFVGVVIICASQLFASCQPVAHHDLFPTVEACRGFADAALKGLVEHGLLGGVACLAVREGEPA